MRGETEVETLLNPNYPISIHSPHARGDDVLASWKAEIGISIHSPHARGD